MLNEIVNELTEIYNNLFTDLEKPSWAVHKVNSPNKYIHCTIPFVGKNYQCQKIKVLVYASAENLSNYNGYLDDDMTAINRHRLFFDTSINKDNFFPSVHMKPMSDGSLLIASLHIILNLYMSKGITFKLPKTPFDFLEQIAFANFCKYTIQSEKNKDYAKDRAKLMHSENYVEQDIALLKPDYIIMPITIYNKEKAFIDNVKGNSTIIPIYQINYRTVNLIINSNFHAYNKDNLHPLVSEWYNNLWNNSKTKANYLSVFTYLDKVLSERGLLYNKS